MSAYKTEAVAKQQASKKHGKNWQETFSLVQGDEGWEIVAKLPEVEPEVEPEASNSEPEELEESVPQSNGVCSALFGAMLNPETVPPAPAPAAKPVVEKTGKTIEPNRPEQNGLKRPSKGSTCCIIWDTCDKLTSPEHTCTSAELFNALQGYNECTLRTQYARWRQFNGITGRLPGQNKAAKLPAAFDDAKDVLLSRVANESAQATLEEVATAADLIQWIADNASNF